MNGGYTSFGIKLLNLRINPAQYYIQVKFEFQERLTQPKPPKPSHELLELLPHKRIDSVSEKMIFQQTISTRE